ncbi:beta-alanine-activating enzyme isoform X1 [Hylaeus volcanicus]|uniref:beta-alanine-activating enzyme isoform X1 n=1 Tax=Hylaeus volcanicus TaxID=313075 RepID=UPI0023B8633B|nr:beta-alanine-activating enzyme isoform X1 [Hylaeus volcanicus]XP_053972318.1 beta-alanine-activating enzyme isoform X1 [Hylaeus volcanicus]XP_053972319.1 beta-alanine-activating enzyme isoform X1 [Hylaeus volcanicus]XP_053972320.1 beta-alanine-activating enzyme isoform X1 [Hylaeus volcanicus]
MLDGSNKTQTVLSIQQQFNIVQKLHNTCKWNDLDNVAIEYHDLEKNIYINYRELFAAKTMLFDFLKCIECSEFIGINYDVPNYCVVSLMLGILTSKHSFVNIPSNVTEYRNLQNSLHIHYLFCKQITVEGDILKQFSIHSECIYFIKLKHIKQKCTQNLEPNYYAYAITTSGSTGASKVVKVSHASIVPNILDLSRILTINSSDKIAQITSFTFDPSIIEIFLALSNAGTLFMASKSLKNNTNRFLDETYYSKITILQMTPSSFLYSWTVERLKATILSNDTSLRVLLLGGEPFPKIESLLEAKHPHNNTKIYNIYGITEVSCWASINEIVTTNLQINTHCLGQLLSQTMFQVRDEKGEIVTNGRGFLHIGSNDRICVIDHESTENLVPPIYRDTGDIVYVCIYNVAKYFPFLIVHLFQIDEGGSIFYKGRSNSIIKRFGNKVDLTKLEECALQVDFVKNCYVLWDESSNKLHLCLVTNKKINHCPNMNIDIVKHLHKLHPLYRPDKIHFLKHFEYNSNGKISIEFLKKYIEEQMNKITDNVDFQKCENLFRSLWKNSLKCENNGFVQSGGTSIIALQISHTLSNEVNVEFPEIIGMLLNNATDDDCLSYIKKTLSNNPKDKTINHLEYHSDNNQTVSLVNATTNVESKHSNSVTMAPEIYKYQWHKCRGQIHSSTTITNENLKLQYNIISKIEIIKTYDLRKCVDASPTVFHYSDGKTYATVGSHSGLLSTFYLEKESCIPPFTIKLPDRIEASVLILDDFRGIVGCYDGNVYCLDLKMGLVIWKYQTGDVVKCSAIFCKQRKTVFVGSYNHHIYCLDVKDGSQIWKVKSSNGSISASGCLHSRSNSVLFGTLDGSCLALEQLSGKILWKHKMTDPIFVAPVTLNNGLVLICSVTGLLSCFDIENNVEIWKYKVNGNVFSYIVKHYDQLTGCENIILASQNKTVYYLQSTDSSFRTEPTLKYVLNLHSPIFATPWCEGNILFITCTDGTLYIYNFTTNRLQKVEKLPAEVFSSLVAENDIAVVGCRDNNVYVLKLIGE